MIYFRHHRNSLEDFFGITGDADGTWAFAMFHAMEFSEVSGVMLGTFWLTAPLGVSFSGLLEEVLGDMIDVFVLVFHLL